VALTRPCGPDVLLFVHVAPLADSDHKDHSAKGTIIRAATAPAARGPRASSPTG
jgi:hypothetical protein